MALSVLSKVALCVCPPVAMATAVATVPPIKRAVHHATAKPARTAAGARPARAGAVAASEQPPCIPGVAGAVPLATPTVPLVTFADPGLADLPGTGVGSPVVGGGGAGGLSGPGFAGFPPIALPIGGGGGGVVVPADPGTPGVTPTPAPTPTPTPTASPVVPEPATWALMIGGLTLVGVAVRRRRTRAAMIRLGGVGTGWMTAGGAGAVGEAGATLAAAPSLTAAVTKAALCVCPPALLATAAVTVPPVRSAVHAATAPVLATAAYPPTVTLLPCPEVTFAPPSQEPVASERVAIGPEPTVA